MYVFFMEMCGRTDFHVVYKIILNVTLAVKFIKKYD